MQKRSIKSSGKTISAGNFLVRPLIGYVYVGLIVTDSYYPFSPPCVSLDNIPVWQTLYPSAQNRSIAPDLCIDLIQRKFYLSFCYMDKYWREIMSGCKNSMIVADNIPSFSRIIEKVLVPNPIFSVQNESKLGFCPTGFHS